MVDAALEVHRTLGAGLLESVYEECLARELSLRGRQVQRQLVLPVSYKGALLQRAYRIDMLVDDMVIVEVKAVRQVHPIHVVQLLTYLRWASKPIGLLLNFHSPMMRDGITRLANNL